MNNTKMKQYPRRAEGKIQTSISISEDVLDAARAAAESERRSLSKWLEMLIDEMIPDGQESAPKAIEAPRPEVVAPDPLDSQVASLLRQVLEKKQTDLEEHEKAIQALRDSVAAIEAAIRHFEAE